MLCFPVTQSTWSFVTGVPDTSPESFQEACFREGLTSDVTGLGCVAMILRRGKGAGLCLASVFPRLRVLQGNACPGPGIVSSRAVKDFL